MHQEFDHRKTLTDLKSLRLNTEVITSERMYVLNPHYACQFNGVPTVVMDPFQIQRDCLKDFLEFCTSQINPSKPKEKDKIEIAGRVLLEENGAVGQLVNYRMGSLYKNSRAEIRELPKYETLLKSARNVETRAPSTNSWSTIQEIMLEELFTFLDSRSDKNLEKNELYRRILEKYQPGIYEKAANSTVPNLSTFLPKPRAQALFLLRYPYNFVAQLFRGVRTIHKLNKMTAEGRPIGDCFELKLSRNLEEMRHSALATGESCIRGNKDHFEKFSEDPATLFMTAAKNGVVLGYIRMFLLSTDSNVPLLGIDTIEPPRKDFEKHIQLVQAMSLAAIWLGLDIGVKYVVAQDSRIKFGPRQAFGNTERTIRARKLGRAAATSYTMPNNNSESKEFQPFILMENWRR